MRKNKKLWVNEKVKNYLTSMNDYHPCFCLLINVLFFLFILLSDPLFLFFYFHPTALFPFWQPAVTFFGPISNILGSSPVNDTGSFIHSDCLSFLTTGWGKREGAPEGGGPQDEASGGGVKSRLQIHWCGLRLHLGRRSATRPAPPVLHCSHHRGRTHQDIQGAVCRLTIADKSL